MSGLPGISGHADQEELLHWAGSFKENPKRYSWFMGKMPKICDSFAQLLRDTFGYDAMAPYSGTIYNLAENVCVKEAEGIRIKKQETAMETAQRKAVSNVFARLLNRTAFDYRDSA